MRMIGKPNPGEFFQIFVGDNLVVFCCSEWNGSTCVTTTGYNFRWYEGIGFKL